WWFVISDACATMLSAMVILASILQSAIMIEFSISHCFMEQLLSIDTWGPILAAGPMLQLSPIMTGPVINESRDTLVFFPIAMFPCIWVSLSMRNWFCVPMVSRTSWFACRISSGVPVSFHQPVTISYSMVFPFSIKSCNASVISSSPLQDGLSISIISNIFG